MTDEEKMANEAYRELHSMFMSWIEKWEPKLVTRGIFSVTLHSPNSGDCVGGGFGLNIHSLRRYYELGEEMVATLIAMEDKENSKGKTLH